MSRIDDAMEKAGLVPASDRPQPTDLFDPDSEWEVEVTHAGPNSETTDATAPASHPRGTTAPVARMASSSSAAEDFPGLPDDVDPHYEDKLLAGPGMEFQSVEQFRRLSAMLHMMQENDKTKTLLVSSAVPAEGKTLTACNLALCLSGSYQRRVLLVDADLRCPTIHHLLRVPGAVGLSDWLRADTKTGPIIERVSKNLSVLPAGKPDPDPMGILTSPRMQELVTDAADTVDWIILDSPPVGLLSDGHLLSRMADAVILVVRAAHTAHSDIQRAIDSLGRQRIAGVVLNQVEKKTTDRYTYSYKGYGGNYTAPPDGVPPPKKSSWLPAWFSARS